jgi:hypothetical protein
MTLGPRNTNSFGLTPPVYDRHVTALNELRHGPRANTYNVIAIQPVYGASVGSTEHIVSSIVLRWPVFTELLPGNALKKPVTLFIWLIEKKTFHKYEIELTYDIVACRPVTK